jgi:hypothetical protein
MGSSSLKASKRKRRRKWIFQRHPERGSRIGALLADGDVLQKRGEQDVVRSRAFGSCILGNPASWIPEIQKPPRIYKKSYITFTTVVMKVKLFFRLDSGSSGFPVIL